MDDTRMDDDAPLGEDAPPCSEDTPLVQEHTPPCPGATPPVSRDAPPVSDDAPLSQEMPPPSTISAPLRADLCRVWVLGFLDAMAGFQVNDDDAIPSDIAEALVKLSESSINGAEDFIAQVFLENPKLVYGVVYQDGFDLSTVMDGATAINLN